MTHISVREAFPNDDFAVGELLVLAFESTYARKMPEVVVDDRRKSELRAVADKREKAAVFVAEFEGKVVGTVSIFPPGAPTSEAWLPNAVDLRHLAVHPDYHGMGISKHLLERTEAVAFGEWKADLISLHVRRGAHGVARLYIKRGYVRDASGDLQKPTVYLEGYVLRAPVL